MRWPTTAIALLAGLLAVPPAAPSQAQVTCPAEHDRISNACPLGSPTQAGVSVQGAITTAGQTRTYKFQVTEAAAAHIYLGDLWYDIDLALVRDPPPGSAAPGEEIGRWHFVAEALTFERRVIQFVRPEIIVEQLTPDFYTLVVVAGDGRAHDPSRPYTLRVALGPPVCATERDPGERYQLGLTVQPREPTAFSLLSFNAFVSPPYTDLFEFDWRVNGQPVGAGERETFQVPVPSLPPAAGGTYRVSVTARGTREYPDPDPRFRHVPPTLSVECTFRVP